MTSKKVGYSSDVWKAIRLLWEASPPTVSWRVILEQVSRALNCEVPGIPTVSTKCTAEMWAKSSKKVPKKSAKNSAKNMQSFRTSDDIENEIKTVISSEDFQDQDKDFSHQKNAKKVRGELVASEGMERIEKAAAKAISGTEQLVEKLRESQVGMFNVNVMCITQLQDFLKKVLDAETLEDLELLKAQMSMIAGAAEMGETLSRTQERVLKGLIGLHGLNPDDFKDRVEAQQMQNKIMLELDAKMEQVKRDMLDQKAKVLNRDIAAIEAGVLTPDEEQIVGNMDSNDHDDDGLNSDGRDDESATWPTG